MADLAALQVQLELQTAAFQAGVKQVDRRLKQMDKNVKKTSRAFVGMEKAMSKLKGGLAGIAASIAAAFSVQAVKNAVEFGDALAKVSDKVGVSVEGLQELRFAAEQSGVATNTLDMAIQRFARRSGEARNGTGELVKVYKQLGIALNDSNGNFKTTEQLLREYADALSKVQDPQERLRLAFKGFDSEGAALVNMLKNGSEGLDDFAQAARDAGIVMSERTARSAEILQNRLSRMTAQIKTKFTEAVIIATEKTLEFFNIFSDKERLTQQINQVKSKIEEIDAVLEAAYARGASANATFFSEKQLADLKDELAGLEAQMKEFGDTTESATSGSSIPQFVNELERIEVAAKRLKNEFDWADDFADSIKDGLNPARVYNKELTKLRAAFSLGKLDVEEFKQAVSNLQDEFLQPIEVNIDTKSMDDFGKSTQDFVDEIKTAIDGFGRDFTNNLVDGLAQGKLAFKDFAKDILATIAKIMLNKVFTQFFETISGSLSTGIAGLFGGGGAPAVPGARSAGPTAKMSLVGVPKPVDYGHRPQRSKASGVTINVNNKSDAQVKTSTREGPNGMEVEFMIEQAVSRQMGSGAYDKILTSRFSGIRKRGY